MQNEPGSSDTWILGILFDILHLCMEDTRSDILRKKQ